jgi:hypothetical protein
VKSSSCDCPEKIPWMCALALCVLVLVAAHPKLRSFVRLCAWSMLLLGPKPLLAHYPAFPRFKEFLASPAMIRLGLMSIKLDEGCTKLFSACYFLRVMPFWFIF